MHPTNGWYQNGPIARYGSTSYRYRTLKYTMRVIEVIKKKGAKDTDVPWIGTDSL
jgi:hypothetical protein